MPISPKPVEPGTSFGEDKEEKRKKQEINFETISPLYSFDDMVISDELKESIEDAISLYLYKDKLFHEWNLGKVIKRPANVSINFYGAPGTGKTMAAHAVADKLGMQLIRVNYAEIESKYVGETSKNLVKLFNEAEEKNAIILFDEADALLSRRVTDMSSATDVSVNQTRSVLLTMLDSFSGIVLFTTNFISNFDSAFMRRIPNHIEFPLPNEEQRIKLLEHYLNGVIPNTIDIALVAQKCDGISGSDIANALINSAIRSARLNKNILSQEDFVGAIEKIKTAKKANSPIKVSVVQRDVTEEYAMNQIKRNGEKNI